MVNLAKDATMVGKLAILLAIVLAVVSGVQDTFDAGSAPRNITTDFINGLGTFGTYASILVLLVIGAYFLMKLKDKKTFG